MSIRTHSFNNYSLNLATPNNQIIQLRSKVNTIILIGLLNISILALFIIEVSLEEKEPNDNYIPLLNSKKVSLISDSEKIPTSHTLSSGPLSNKKEKEQNHYIDIEEMKKNQIKRLDKNSNRITDLLERKIEKKNMKDNWISVIVTAKTNEFQDGVLLFEKFGGVIQYIWDDPEDTVYGFSGDIEVSKIKGFSNQVKSNIELIEENLLAIRNSDVATHLQMIRTHVWDNLNYTGDPNMSIAVLDTGIDDSHTAFSPGYEDQNWDKKIVGWYDTTDDGSTTPEDYIGHGSHVAGIVAANEYNDSYDNERIVTTWSYSYDPERSLSGAFVYIIWVNRTGTIDISYVWQGELSAEGTNLKLYAPNGTLVANDTSGNSNMSVSHVVSSHEDFGYWEVALGVSWGVTGGMLDVAGVNRYPYPEPTDNYSRFAGVAPDVKLVGVKIFDNTGYGTSSEVIEAFNWVKNNKATYHIAIASGSFSFSGTSVSLDSAAAALVNSGVVVVLSAGNYGQGKNSIFSPGQVDGVITVAASDDYDSITSYSSEGPGEMSNTTKPDIVAPGGEVTQGAILQIDSNDADSENSSWSDKVPNDFTNLQGTSMSCPFVSGSLALLIQAMGGYNYWENGHGSATNPFKVKQLILMTANEIYLDDRGGKDLVEGYGRLNIYAAIEAIENTYGIGTATSETLSSELGRRKVWAQNVTLTVETNYSFVLAVPDSTDFDLFLYKPDPNQFGEPILAARSTNFEFGADEYITYTPEISGIYFLVVKTSFTNRGSGTFTLTSTSGSDFPVVSFVSPTENEKLHGQYTVQLDADDSDLKAVYFKIADDSWINTTFTGSHYEYSYNTTALPDGNFSIVAKAVDSQGHITYTSIKNIYTDNFNQPILLVDDDTGPSYEKYYERTLQRLSLYEGIGYDYYSVQTSGSPSSNKLLEYQLVIWYTSTDNSTTLTTTDQTNLQFYLENGGYLWISGQDIGYDISTASFYGNYLHAIYEANSVADNRYVSGVSGELFEHKRYYLGSGAGSGQNEHPSDINANTGASLILYYNNNSDYGAALKYNDTHKVIYLAFNWEAMDFETDRIDSINQSLNWFSLDQMPRSVSITNPINGTTTNRNPTFSWSGTDDYGIEKYAIFRDGVYLRTTTESSLTINDQPEGWHTYRIVAFDGKNQSNVDVVMLLIDTTPPTVNIIFPLNSTYSTPSIPIYVTNLSVVNKAWYRYWNGSWSENNSMIYDSNDDRWEVDGIVLSDGNYQIQVFFNDSVGNEAYSEEWFTIDYTAPTVTILNPSNTTYPTAKVDIFATNSTPINKAWYRYQNGSWSANYSMIYYLGAARWIAENIKWSDGNYKVQVFFNNSAGNEAFSEEYFTVDTTAPIVTIESPSNTSYDQNSVIFTYFVSDGTVSIYFDEIANITTIPNGFLISDLSEGSHNITIVAIDSVGNTRKNTVIFTVESITTPTSPTTTVPIAFTTNPPLTTPPTTFPQTNEITPISTQTTQTESTTKQASGFSLFMGLMIVALLGILIRKVRYPP
ncbi:MAG: S8 family serine peptidase [Candidatus Hodarchaeota archaeon]